MLLNDVWFFIPSSKLWIWVDDCKGDIPSPRERHAACLVDDVMYIFGGLKDNNISSNDLYAFKIAGIP